MKSILVVARDNPARAALAARLDREGYLVMAVGGRTEAAEFLDGVVPGVVIIDLPLARGEMQRMIRALAADAHLSMIPRLLVLRSPGRARKIPDGAAVFAKPLDFEHLVRALAGLYPPPRGQRRSVPAADGAALPARRPPRPAPPLVPVGSVAAVALG
jgi:DNA-binding NtrC family response regulator